MKQCLTELNADLLCLKSKSLCFACIIPNIPHVKAQLSTNNQFETAN